MIEIMGKFTAIGMREAAPPGIVINTCSGNDTARVGDDDNWTWSNPSNRIIRHCYEDVEAVSVERLWQGTKIFTVGAAPDPNVLRGPTPVYSRAAGKGRRPLGAWAGAGRALITDPGEARRRIYLPAFAAMIAHWLKYDPVVADRVARATRDSRLVFLRDWDVGRGLDQSGPMSHAWLLATWLNTGTWPA